MYGTVQRNKVNVHALGLRKSAMMHGDYTGTAVSPHV